MLRLSVSIDMVAGAFKGSLTLGELIADGKLEFEPTRPPVCKNAGRVPMEAGADGRRRPRPFGDRPRLI